MGAIIETTQGGVVTRGRGACDVSIFYRRDFKRKDVPLFEAERDPLAEIKSVRGPESTPSSSTSAITGKVWVEKRNEYPNGSYIRINIRRVVNGIGFSHRINNIIIQPRDTGPLTELAIVLPTDDKTARSKIYMIGRFDIVPMERIEALGLYVSPNGTNDLATFEEVSEMDDIEIYIKEKELASRTKNVKTVVTSSDGSKKVMAKIVTRRKLGLPRR